MNMKHTANLKMKKGSVVEGSKSGGVDLFKRGETATEKKRRNGR